MSRITDGWMKSRYRSKGTDFSATDLTNPNYYMWCKYHFKDKLPKRTTPEITSFKSFAGTAVHQMIEDVDEIGVVKEFSWTKQLGDVTIGGTADDLRYRYTIGKWRLGDVKTKGVYPAEKFLKGENESEVMQLSIYRWLFNDLFDIEDKAVIYLFVMGHTIREAKKGIPEVSEQWIDLIPTKQVETILQGKIAIATHDKAPVMDCPTVWKCEKYCDMKEVCPHYKKKSTPEHEGKEFKGKGFSNES